MNTKKTATCLCALLAFSLLVTGCKKEIEVKNGSKVAVSIKGEKFTATEYYSKIKEENIATLVDMIDKSYLEKEYKDTDEEKDSVEEQITQIKTYYGSNETTYKSVLKSYFGVETEDALREKLKLDFKRTKAVEDYIKENLTDKEIEKYYNDKISGEVKASHILIAIDAKADATDDEKKELEEKALKKAQNIIKKLNDGEDFAKLAKKNSADEGTASKGGDLDYFQPDEMVEEFANAVRELKVDEYTKEPVKTQYGYHIILKTGEKDKPKLKKVEDDIRESLSKEKLESDASLTYKTLDNIRQEKKISWNDSTLKSAYEQYLKDQIESATSTTNK